MRHDLDDGGPLDLSALRPPPERWEAMAAGIAARAAVAGGRPRVARGPLAQVAGWARPTLAAAAVIALVSLAALAAERRAVAAPAAPATVAEAVVLPAPVDDWIVDGSAATERDLMQALEGDNP